MPLDDRSPITPLESGTIRAALKAIAANVVAIVTLLTGKMFDLGVVNQVIDLGVPLISNGITIYYAYRAIHARIDATKTIKKG